MIVLRMRWPSARLRARAGHVGSTADVGRGRDASYPTPPAQTRAGAINAHGSYLGYVWRQSAPYGTGAGCRPRGARLLDALENVPSSSGFSDFAAVAGAAIIAARLSETPSVAPHCQESHDIGNTPLPPTGATSPYPPWLRASATSASSEYPSARLPAAVRSSSGSP